MSCRPVASSGAPRWAAASSGAVLWSRSDTARTVASARRFFVVDGYFPSDGMAWRIGRELALLLGGGRALLLQVAHPLVAAGVAEHSGFREDPWRRLEGTMNAV